jgi:uncharacterized membrane protein
MMHLWVIALTAFLASAVEAVEAATIVLAVGYVQGWRSALGGAALACVALLAIVAIGGPAVVHLIPVRILRIGVGVFLLWFGYGWLRKAILRSRRRMKMRDERAAYDREVDELSGKERRAGFTAAFNGVLVEGFEVAVVVVTIGAGATISLYAAAVGALAAIVLVGVAAAVLRHPLARIPQNALKTVVGVLIVSFGTLWFGEGVGIRWPFGDAALLILVAIYATIVALLGVTRPRPLS